MTPPTIPTSRRRAEAPSSASSVCGRAAGRHDRRGGQALGRAGAAAILLLLVAVPPTVLMLLIGNPFDPPAALRSTRALQQQLDDRTVLYLLAVLVWLVWIHLLGCLITETLQQARGSQLRMPLPRVMFGANALLASQLIAALLMSGSNVTLTPAPSNAALVTTQPATPTSSDVVLGQPHWEPNGDAGVDAGQKTPTTTAPEAKPTAGPAANTVGPISCRVLPPHGRHHDTLWDIAERHLGDGTRWRDIFALNEGRVMPDGQHLTRASLIRPGWILTLPADATALPTDAVITDTPHRHPSAEPGGKPPTSSPTPSRANSGLPHEKPRQDAPQAMPRPAAVTTPPAALPSAAMPSAASLVPGPTSVTNGHSTRGAVPDSTDAGHHSDPNLSDGTQLDAAAEAGLLGLAAVGLLAALTRRRKVAARRRPPGTRPATAAAELLELEGQWRREARSAQDIAAAVRLAALLSARHDSGMRLAAVWHHSDDSLELIPAARSGQVPTAPAPFVCTERGWLLPPDARRFLFATTRTKTVDARLAEELEIADDPFPLLMPAGQQDGSTCLVNLQHFHAVNLTRQVPVPPASQTISSDGAVRPLAGEAVTEDVSDDVNTGDAVPAADVSVPAVVAGWVHQLAGAPWGASCRILLAPPFADLATGLPNASAAGPDDLARLTLAAQDMTEETQAELLVGFPPEQLPATLLTARSGRPSGTSLLFADSPVPAEVERDVAYWTLRQDGTVAIPGIAERLVPTPVTDERLSLILRLLEHAQDPPRATAQDAGVRSRALDTPATPLRPASLGVDTTGHAATPETETTGDDAVAIGTGPDGAEATPETHSVGQRPMGSPVVRVDVLGPVMMTGTSATLGGRLRQVLLYLALHRRPVQPRALWEAVWPDREFNDHSLRSRCNELKRYLHRQLLKDGRAWVLPDSVRCDWQEFKALAAGDTDDKVTALALVRGRPFEDFAPDWVHLEGFASEIEATIVDLALEVATDALDRGDTMTASLAAAAGAKASPYEERLVQLGIRAAQDRGAHSLARSLHRQLSVVLDEEIEPDDTELPATSQLMADLNYAESLHRYQARRASDT